MAFGEALVACGAVTPLLHKLTSPLPTTQELAALALMGIAASGTQQFAVRGVEGVVIRRFCTD